MILQKILDKIGNLSAYQSLNERLQAGLDRVDTAQGLGLPRAARLPVVARLQQDLACPVLLISNRADRALALHEDFLRNGFRICGVFDGDKHKVGIKIGPLTVQGMEEVAEVVSEKKVDIGVLAVPAAAAQEVADTLVAAGVRGLLNLALAHITVPPDVAVIDSRIVASLQELSHSIKMQK